MSPYERIEIGIGFGWILFFMVSVCFTFYKMLKDTDRMQKEIDELKKKEPKQ